MFLISDTHFNHDNMLVFKRADGVTTLRHHANVDEMNEDMIDKWNKTVGPNDLVWHLGDVFFGSANKADKILRRLNGNKRLVLGNHDHDFAMLSKHFREITVWKKLKNLGIFLTHFPLHPQQMGEMFGHDKVINIHGHIHANDTPVSTNPNQRWINVGVEKTGYAPMHIDEVLRTW